MDGSSILKGRLKKAIIIFLSIMALFVIISRTIYSYLLPVVKVEKADYGSIETKFIADGKIGLDETALKNNKVTVTASIGGKLSAFELEEGKEVKAGETLFSITKDKDSLETQNAQLDGVELTLRIESLLRQVQNNEERRQVIEANYEKKKRESQNVDSASELLELEKQIDEQKNIVAMNEELHAEQLIEEAAYKREKAKLELLEKKKIEVRNNKIGEMEKELEAFKEQLDALEINHANMTDEILLNQKKLNIKQGLIEEEVIKSPIDGSIYTLNVGARANVEKGEELVVIIPKGISYSLSFEVADDQTEDIAIGREVTFLLNQIPKQAKVVKKSLNQETGYVVISCEVEEEVLEQLELDNKSYKKVLVEIVNSSNPYNCTVSNSAIITEYGTSYIYVIEEREGVWGKTYKARKVNANILEEGDYKTAIQAAISKEDKLIKYPLSSLKDGVEVGLEVGEEK